MIFTLARFRVEDYDKWRQAFEQGSEIRRAAGSKSAHIFRGEDVPEEVVITLQWEDVGQARAFTGSTELRELMQRAGVIGQPDIYFLSDEGRLPA